MRELQQLPRTNDEFEKLRVTFRENQTMVSALVILWACALGVLITAVPWVVPATKLPEALQPLWNPYGLILPVGATLWLLLALAPPARESKRYKKIGEAINAYDRAVAHYADWSRTGKRKHLKECHEYLQLTRSSLHEVPMVIQFAEKAEASYREFEE